MVTNVTPFSRLYVKGLSTDFDASVLRESGLGSKVVCRSAE